MTALVAPLARQRRLSTALKLAAKVAAVTTAIWFLAVPQLPLAWSAIGAVGSAQPVLIAIAALCAVAALMTYAQLMRTAIDEGPRPGLWHTLGIITTSLGVSNVIPGGSAAGSIVTFKMLERSGVGRARAATAMAFTSIGSALVLNILLGVGLLTVLPTYGLASGALAAVPATALLAMLAATAHAVTARNQRLWAVARFVDRRVPGGHGHVVSGLEACAQHLQLWRRQPRMLRRAALWAATNWLIDVAALWLILAAVGLRLSPASVLVAFALANLAAMIPLTPGGLGVVELTMTATLVGLGADAAPAAIGVAIYRLFNFWAPIPLSAVSYLATRWLAPATATAAGEPPAVGLR